MEEIAPGIFGTTHAVHYVSAERKSFIEFERGHDTVHMPISDRPYNPADYLVINETLNGKATGRSFVKRIIETKTRDHNLLLRIR